MAEIQHRNTSKDHNGGKGGHPIQGWSDEVDGPARVALIQAAVNRGIAIYQT